MSNNPQTDRRERYAAAIRENAGWVLDDGQHMIDAVMAVADAELAARRAADLRDAEEICDEAGASYTAKALNEQADGAYELMARFRRKAEEAEQTAAAVPVPPTTHATVRAEAFREAATYLDHRATQLAEGLDDLAAFVAKARMAMAKAYRDAAAELRFRADCPSCEAGVEHDAHCPTPLTHGWGCGCPTDPAPTDGPSRMADEAQQQPDTETRDCPDPVECGHEAALGQARQEVCRLGLMVDEYGAGASALTDKLKRARDMHRETCPLAQGVILPPAVVCSMCEVLDAPAMPVKQPVPGPGRVADEEQGETTG